MKIRLSTIRNSRLERAAYTLVEVVISVAVMAVMFVSLYAGMSFGFAVTQFEREDLRATQVLLERLEGIRLFRFDQLSPSDPVYPGGTFTSYYYPLAAGGQSQGIAYSGTMTVESSPVLTPAVTYSANMKKVTVTIQWNSGNLTHTRSMSTYVARHGVQNYIYNN